MFILEASTSSAFASVSRLWSRRPKLLEQRVHGARGGRRGEIAVDGGADRRAASLELLATHVLLVATPLFFQDDVLLV
jgi:hypothetical protein